MKKNIIVASIQTGIVLVFAISNYFMFRVEKIILNPIPYIVCLALPLTIVDLAALIYIFKENNKGDTEAIERK